MFVIVGLGNPGEKYINTRHNVGRDALETFRKEHGFSDWVFEKKMNALVSDGELGREKVKLILPETFMNKSGLSLKSIITSTKKAHNLVVVHDDLDIPIGEMKISFNRGSGGHRGIESIVKVLGTKEFSRVRLGICPVSFFGKPQKPRGEAAVSAFVLKKFTKSEEGRVEQVFKKTVKTLEDIVKEGVERAMGKHN